MANCVTRNNNGAVQSVTVNNEPSVLFEQIENLPFIKDKEQALQYYVQINELAKSKRYSGNLVTNKQGEPKLVFKGLSANNSVFNSRGFVYEDNFVDAHKNDVDSKGVLFGLLRKGKDQVEIQPQTSNSKTDVELSKALDNQSNLVVANYANGKTRYGAQSTSDFVPIDKYQPNANDNSYEGFVANMIESGIPLTNKQETTVTIQRQDNTIIANIGTKIVGRLRLIPVEGGAKVDSVRVDPDFQEQGIGTNLYLEAKDEFGTVYSDDFQTPAAKRLWERLVADGEAIRQEDGTYRMETSVPEKFLITKNNSNADILINTSEITKNCKL